MKQVRRIELKSKIKKMLKKKEIEKKKNSNMKK